MKELNLQELLRYALAGGVGVAAWYSMFPYANQKVGAAKDLAETTLTIGGALLLGSVIYGLHRALAYPLIHRGILLLMCSLGLFRFDVKLLIAYRPAALELALDFWRWRAAEKKHFSQPTLGEWGAQVHFLYCSAWAILLAFLFGRLGGIADQGRWRAALVIVMILLVSALMHNARLIYVIRKLMLLPSEEEGNALIVRD